VVALLLLAGGGTLSAQVVTPDAGTTAPSKPEAVTPPAQIEEVSGAVELFKRQDYDGAAALLEKAAKAHPELDLPPSNVVMFQLFAQTNQPALARMSLDKATMSNPDDPEAFVTLADIALQDRRVTEAELLFNKARELLQVFKGSTKRKDRLGVMIDSGLAQVAEDRQKWDIAQGYLEKLLKANPKDSVALQRLARALFQQKNAAEALQKLRDAKAADKTVLTPEAVLGRYYEIYGDHSNAVKWMTKSLSTAPEDLDTRLFVAQWELMTGQIDEAKTQTEKALVIDPKSLPAKILRGIVALFQKDYPEAEKWFQDAHLQSPSNFAASNNLALALCEQNDESKSLRALEYATTNYQQNPKNADAASTLGWVFYKRKDLDKAEQALRLAFSNAGGKPSGDTLYYLARLFYDRGRKWDSKLFVESALRDKSPFTMRREALDLEEKVKNEPDPSKAAR
jgi:Tfp pilus assembly protein PilF